jgi:hypothetical protein
MSPCFGGIFQLLKGMTFRRILAFLQHTKWGYFGVFSGTISQNPVELEHEKEREQTDQYSNLKRPE